MSSFRGPQTLSGYAGYSPRLTRRDTADSPNEKPLSPEQRTRLERLVKRVMSLSPLQAAEIWAGFYHETGLKNEQLQSRHFPAAEHYLQKRLVQVQTMRDSRQLLHELGEWLPLGNNRQAVSHYIRRQFGHTKVSSLSAAQLQQVITLLQNGQLTPDSPKHLSTFRRLLPAEQKALKEHVFRLAAVTGEQPADLWTSMRRLVKLKTGEPIPSHYFVLLTHWLQARQSLSLQQKPTLKRLMLALKQPPDDDEKQMLETYSQQHFQATLSTPLKAIQAQALISLLFSRRAEKLPRPAPLDKIDKPNIFSHRQFLTQWLCSGQCSRKRGLLLALLIVIVLLYHFL